MSGVKRGLPRSSSRLCCPSGREALWLLVTGDRFWMQVAVSFRKSIAKALEFAFIPGPCEYGITSIKVLHTGTALSKGT